MATSTKRTVADAGDGDLTEAGAGPAAWQDVAQRQLATAAEAASQMFSRVEAMQRTQLQLVERAALLHRQAADNLRKATSPFELASVQGTLWVYQCQEAMRFWQEWMGVLARAGGEAAQAASAARGAAAGDGADAGTTGAMGAAMNAAAPMAEAFQQMFMAPLQAAAKPH